MFATVRQTQSNDDMFGVTVFDVQPSSVQFNLTRWNGQSWAQSLLVDWLAMDPELPLPDNAILGSVALPAVQDANVAYPVHFPRPVRCAEPSVLAAVRMANGALVLGVTTTNHMPTGFTVNLASFDRRGNWPAGIQVDYFAFERDVPCLPVTATPVRTSVVRGRYVQTIQQVWRDHYAQTVRVYSDGSDDADLAYVELVNDIGPLDEGRELVARFTTDIDTAPAGGSVWYTSANGFEMRRRTYDPLQTERIAGNYYPMVDAAYLRDQTRDVRLTLLSDRTHGCGSTRNGELEAMYHRRCLRDDGYGVGEVLNENFVFQTTTLLLLDRNAESAAAHKRTAILMASPPSLWLGVADGGRDAWAGRYRTSKSVLLSAFPPNVHLLNLAIQDPTGDPMRQATILRLEHPFEAGEHPVLSQPASVNLTRLFDRTQFAFNTMVETTLSANVPLSRLDKLRWNVAGESAPASVGRAMRAASVAPLQADWSVVLGPREIRTFVVNAPTSPATGEASIAPAPHAAEPGNRGRTAFTPDAAASVVAPHRMRIPVQRADAAALV